MGLMNLIFLLMLSWPMSQALASESGSGPLPQDVQDMVVLTVDKTKLRADLRTWPEDHARSNVLMSFRIAIGKNEGDKQFAGDNKTPEGIYFAQSVIDGATLPPKYGPKAIPINFPNPFDQLAGKTGHGIWLHGVDLETRISEAKVTEGCVAFYNADIAALTKWLRPYQSVVMIGSRIEDLNRIEDTTSLGHALKDWAKAWSDRRIADYARYYSDSFAFKGMNRDQYKKYKSAVFAGYKQMTVSLTDLRTFTHAKYGMTVVNQDFNGDDRYLSRGRKILYWERDHSQGWQIRAEVFESRRLEFGSLSSSELTQFGATSPSAKFFSESSAPANL